MNDVFCLKKAFMEMLLTTMESRAAVFNFSSDNIYVSDKLYDIFGADGLDPDDPVSRQHFIENLKENSVKTASQSELCSHRSGIVDSDEKYLIFHLFHAEGTYFGYFVDMTEEVFGKLKLRKELSETKKKSQTDALTGVLNRNGFETTVKDYMKCHSDACVLCIMDMDNFKKVNDTLGHPVGDKVLKEFASILTEAFSKKAFVGRIGGDEFVVFFKEKITRSELSEMLGDLIMTVKGTFQAEYPDKNLSSSIGAAMGLGEYADLYRTADSALYEVKKAGKGTYNIVD